MNAWYNDPAQLAARLAEFNGNVTHLARATGVARTTLESAKARMGVSFEPAALEYGVSEELTRQNQHLTLENKRLRAAAIKAADGEAAADLAMSRIERAIAERGRQDFPVNHFERPSRGERTPQEMLLEFSDLHASETISRESTMGMNEYNWDIMMSRVNEVQTTIFSHASHFGFRISKLHIAMLGDMLSGDIHDELAITNDRPTVEAVVDLAHDLVPWLLGFAEEFPFIEVTTVPGNHPRFAKKPSAKQYHNNADWLMYQHLAALLKDHPQFSFSIPRSAYNTVLIGGRWRMLLMHGDGIRTTMPGVPWGGISRRVHTLDAQFAAARQPIDYIAMGHWHTKNTLDGIQAETFMNGSVKGLDEYGLQRFGSGHRASQQLHTFHPERGWTGQYACDLQPKTPGGEGW